MTLEPRLFLPRPIGKGRGRPAHPAVEFPGAGDELPAVDPLQVLQPQRREFRRFALVTAVQVEEVEEGLFRLRDEIVLSEVLMGPKAPEEALLERSVLEDAQRVAIDLRFARGHRSQNGGLLGNEAVKGQGVFQADIGRGVEKIRNKRNGRLHFPPFRAQDVEAALQRQKILFLNPAMDLAPQVGKAGGVEVKRAGIDQRKRIEDVQEF